MPTRCAQRLPRAHTQSSNFVISKEIMRKPQERKKYSQEFIAEIERREDTNFIATAIKNQWKEILDTGFTSSDLARRYNRHCKLHGRFAKKAIIGLTVIRGRISNHPKRKNANRS